MKAISIKIFEDFTTNEFLRENILDFQFVTSNRTKDELIWKIVRNGTVLNRFIPFYVKDLYKEEIIFLCNELQIKTEGQIIDDLKRQILKKWNSDSPDILHHELIGKFSDKEFLRDYLKEYVFATTGKKDFLISIITENLELHEFVLKKLFDNLETEQLTEICIYLEQNKKDLFEFSSLTNAGIMRKELSEQWNKTIFEINENDDEKPQGLFEKMKELKSKLDEAWQESGTAQTIDFEKLRKLKDDLTDNLKDDFTDIYRKVENKIDENIVKTIEIMENKPKPSFEFKNKNFFMINGPWVNWKHSLENRINGEDVLWATRGADPSDVGIFNKLRIGDLVFFSNSTKDPGPFSKKVIFGFGVAKEKFQGSEPYWPDEREKNTVIYKYRFSIKPIFETYDEIEAIPWIGGLPFTKGFNSIANPEKISELSKTVGEKWNVTEKTQEELDGEFYKDKSFERGEKISEQQLEDLKESAYPDKLNSEFSVWEERIFKKITGNNILFEPKPWTYPLPDEQEGYIPDAELDGLCMCGRKVVVEANENFTEEDAKKYQKFVLEYYQSRYLILIVPDEQKKIWEDYQKLNKILSCRELWSETEAGEKIDAVYQLSDRYAMTQLPEYTICPQCQMEAKSQQEVFEIFGSRKKTDGRIITQSHCKQCR